MKQNGTNTEAPDEIVRMAIAYLDSPTNYHEFIGRTEQPVMWHGPDQTPQSQKESLWLLLVPIVVIIIAVIALIAR